MKKFRFHVGFFQIIILAILIGGLGGILSDVYPRIGVAMAIIGIIGAVIDRYASEIQSKQIDNLFDAQALLLANKGLGNLYTEAGKIELEKGGAKAVEHFQKALEINPDDKEALASLGAILALELSNQNWLCHSKGTKYKTILSTAKKCAIKGKQIAPKVHEFYDILGIIYDAEGNHDLAQKEFQMSGKLRNDPYWHLLLATSLGMSKQHDKELAEVQEAVKKGAKYWLVDFYYGRALVSNGEYEQAVVELKKALQSRKWQPQVLRHLADAYYFQGHFGKAAKYAALCAFALVKWYPASSLHHFGLSIHHFGLYVTCSLSKRLWPISRHIPIIKSLHQHLCSPAQPEATLGVKLIEEGHYKYAEKHLRMACKVLPNIPEFWANLCCSLAFQNKREEAIEACEKAIQCARDESMLNQLK